MAGRIGPARGRGGARVSGRTARCPSEAPPVRGRALVLVGGLRFEQFGDLTAEVGEQVQRTHFLEREPSETVRLPCVLGEKCSFAGQRLTDVGEVDMAVLGFRAGRDALTQDHPWNVQDLDDARLAQCLVPGTHDAAMHSCFLEDLAEACFVWCLVGLHVTARVDPDMMFAVIDQQDAVISQDKTRRGEVFGQELRPGRQKFRHDDSVDDVGRHTSSQILATMSWLALGLPRRLRLPDISWPLPVNMSSSAARKSCSASSAAYAASCCVRNRVFAVSWPGRGSKITSGTPTAAASASVTPPALLTSRSAACMYVEIWSVQPTAVMVCLDERATASLPIWLWTSALLPQRAMTVTGSPKGLDVKVSHASRICPSPSPPPVTTARWVRCGTPSMVRASCRARWTANAVRTGMPKE